jgi:hypothetical protein
MERPSLCCPLPPDVNGATLHDYLFDIKSTIPGGNWVSWAGGLVQATPSLTYDLLRPD